jgi:hypothetical protein
MFPMLLRRPFYWRRTRHAKPLSCSAVHVLSIQIAAGALSSSLVKKRGATPSYCQDCFRRYSEYSFLTNIKHSSPFTIHQRMNILTVFVESLRTAAKSMDDDSILTFRKVMRDAKNDVGTGSAKTRDMWTKTAEQQHKESLGTREAGNENKKRSRKTIH